MLTRFENDVVKALGTIAECQLKQTQIAEQSFKEAKELRDYTMGMLKKDEKDIEFAKKILKDKNFKPVVKSKKLRTQI